MTTFQISQVIDSSDESFLHLICEGNLTIKHVDEIRKQLVFPMKKVNKLELILRNVISLDFAFLQLTIALIKEFLEGKGKSFQFNFQLNDESSQLLDKTGLLAIFENYRDIK